MIKESIAFAEGVKETIEGVEYTFKPLPFRHYPKLFGVIKATNNVNTKLNQKKKEGKLSEEEVGQMMFDILSEEDIEKIITLEKIMVMSSYPEEPEKKVETFVMKNMFSLLGPLISSNLGEDDKAKRRTKNSQPIQA
jgi:hypothetical protein